MAAMLNCSTAHVVHNAPVALSLTVGQPNVSPAPVLHLRRQLAGTNLALRLSQRQISNRGVLVARASTDSDNVRDLASEKAVEGGKEVADDATKLANGQSPAVLDAKADDASDAASYSSDVREKVVDVASDMAVDSMADVDELAKKDASPLAKESGRSVEESAEALESKAAEVSDREARKES